MKTFAGIIVAALAAQGASAHYIFTTFSPGTTKAAAYEYVRRNTNNNSPVLDLASNDLRCNVGGATGANTTTIEVAAGSPFTFTLDQVCFLHGVSESSPNVLNNGVYRPYTTKVQSHCTCPRHQAQQPSMMAAVTGSRPLTGE